MKMLAGIIENQEEIKMQNLDLLTIILGDD